MKKITFESQLYLTNYRKYPAVDANELISDLNKITKEIKNKMGWTKLPRHFLPQQILNRISAGYLSPTMLKSYTSCPCNYLYSMLVPRDKQQATYIGTSFHTIVQRFYDLDPEKRDKERYYKLADQVIKEDKVEGAGLNTLKVYVDGFWTAPDYITGPEGELLPMQHKNIQTKTEYFVKDELTPLGINMSEDPENIESLPTYTLMDRIDFRKIGNDEKMFIIDYKTGMGNARQYNLGINGYLPQMIFYKWAAESVFNRPVDEAYLMLPGADDQDCKWVKMDVNSLVNQSMVIEQVVSRLKDIKEIRKTGIFPERNGTYCGGSCYVHNLINELRSKGPISESDKIIPVKFEIDEREMLESALESQMILTLPDDITTLDQWVDLSKDNHHEFEKEYILNDENRTDKENFEKLQELGGSDIDDEDDDW